MFYGAFYMLAMEKHIAINLHNALSSPDSFAEGNQVNGETPS
jgi:hypothetical protein